MESVATLANDGVEEIESAVIRLPERGAGDDDDGVEPNHGHGCSIDMVHRSVVVEDTGMEVIER